MHQIIGGASREEGSGQLQQVERSGGASPARQPLSPGFTSRSIRTAVRVPQQIRMFSVSEITNPEHVKLSAGAEKAVVFSEKSRYTQIEHFVIFVCILFFYLLLSNLIK